MPWIPYSLQASHIIHSIGWIEKDWISFFGFTKSLTGIGQLVIPLDRLQRDVADSWDPAIILLRPSILVISQRTLEQLLHPRRAYF
jgi:hypothetical protein